MKTTFKLFLLLVGIFIITSCEDSVSQGRKLWKMYYHHILNDPESFKIYDEKYTRDGDYSVNWTLDYGAKNSLGGMVRKTDTFSTVTDDMISIDGSIYFRDNLK